MGIFDAYPKAWTSAQIRAFDNAYAQMVRGQFTWTDFIPPLGLVGATAKVYSLSLKALVHFSDKNGTALNVESVHNNLKQGWTPKDIFDIYGVKYFKLYGSTLERIEVFWVFLKLEKIVYGADSGWESAPE